MASAATSPCRGRPRQLLIIVALFTISTPLPVYGIKCVRCTTFLDRACGYGNIEPTECDPDARYCITYIGKMKGGMVIFRDCIRNRLESVCFTEKIEGQNVRICYETCAGDGCNEGHVTVSHVTLLSVSLMAFSVALL